MSISGHKLMVMPKKGQTSTRSGLRWEDVMTCWIPGPLGWNLSTRGPWEVPFSLPYATQHHQDCGHFSARPGPLGLRMDAALETVAGGLSVMMNGVLVLCTL